MRILGIESSCDETAAAVYDGTRGLLSNVVSSQVAIHGAYGGVVPELASREHLKSVVPVVEKALADASSGRDSIDGISVTSGPGLIGSLLVGLCFAKVLSFAWGKPLYGADHLESHIYAVFLERRVEFPYIALLVFGGHTSLFRVSGWSEVRQLGGTLDDAAGEAFDKAAKMMGLGYPSGMVIDRLSGGGDPARYAFPRARLAADSADFSFSGLKTALRTFLASPEGATARIEDVAASFQEAIVDVLVSKAIDAARREGIPRLVLSGGCPRIRGFARRRRGGARRRASRCSSRPSRYAPTTPPWWSCWGSAGCPKESRPRRSRTSMPPPDSQADHPRRALATLGLSPRKSFGQNFLHDRNISRKIVDLARSFHPPYLEIGPGLGALTRPLADAGEPVVAVEVDRGLAAHLRREYAGISVDVMEADFLG